MTNPAHSSNPFKNGPYQPYLSKLELAGLRKIRLVSLDQEIGVLRVSIERLMKLGKDEQDVEAQTKIARGVAQLVTALNATLRTHDQLPDPDMSLQNAYDMALRLEPFTGINRVAIENLLEEYRDKLDAQKIIPGENRK